ncbi:TetR family transcriptional regulator [Sneathiella sp. P13V-1]|uniref:TetR/AcrR family transcriptional regulator n=1 Tax=Sneathiella sp. P13V-1 TaxID=2697366 RepID=UPI00187BAAA1|nr:TetR/AcrR family transcriptional regulator [Sneathiella sp. P13V-1]MBE7636150.1 TetR family transcriptional regulator [Sneathiella sp. P13V-1]
MKAKKSGQGYQPAKQERSRKSEQRFLDAAQKLYLEKGFAATGVADIIKKSKGSTGSFYHRFSDKRDVFDVMLEQFIESAKERTKTLDLSRDTHGDLESLLFFYARSSFELTNSNLGFYRAAQEITVHDPAVWEHLKELALRIGDLFVENVGEFADEIAVEDKETAMRQAVQIIITMTIQTALGSGPMLPADPIERAEVIARAAKGVLMF